MNVWKDEYESEHAQNGGRRAHAHLNHLGSILKSSGKQLLWWSRYLISWAGTLDAESSRIQRNDPLSQYQHTDIKTVRRLAKAKRDGPLVAPVDYEKQNQYIVKCCCKASVPYLALQKGKTEPNGPLKASDIVKKCDSNF